MWLAFVRPFLILAIFAISTHSLNVDDVVHEAESELYYSGQQRMIDGARTKAAQGRKITKMSVTMETRNKLFRSVRDKLIESGEARSKATKLANEALENRGHHSYFAGGQGAFTGPVKMVDDMCEGKATECNSDFKYSRIDGKCNNLLPGRVMWGAMSSPYNRRLPRTTFDAKKINVITLSIEDIYGRTGNDGSERSPLPCTYGSYQPQVWPSARLVSTQFHGDVDTPDNRFTHMLTQMGQFVDHDLALTPEHHAEGCCGIHRHDHDECLPIDVPPNDPFYTRHSIRCLDFTRSVLFCEGSRIKEEVNALTHFLDGSAIYGSDYDTLALLRDKRDGLMLTGPGNLLPKEGAGFTAGDVRAIEMPGLAAIHTLWLREHNRLARALRKVRPGWNDERLFQEARRITVAQLQNVVYGEFLPAVLGPKVTSDPFDGIGLSSAGSIYEPDTDPSISSEFATAAYRFGHSMIQGTIQRYDPATRHLLGTYKLRNNFFNVSRYETMMDSILLGLTVQPGQRCDAAVTEDTTNHLFDMGKGHGSDLISRNIQRGRDHGLAGYVAHYNELHSDLTNVTCWATVSKHIPEQTWRKLVKFYMHPYDIDLFTAGLLETPVDGGVVGPTFHKILVDQFRRLKVGDRFFFTHTGQIGSFTKAQRTAIMNRRLSDIICDNTDIVSVQGNTFRLPHPHDNPVELCNENSRKLDASIFAKEDDDCEGISDIVLARDENNVYNVD